MGAEYQTMIVKSKNRKEVEEKFEREQEDDLYENGHSYSGGFGMAPGLDFTCKHFKSYDEADEYLRKTCQKWENALAVTYDDGKNTHYLIGAVCSS